MDTNKPIITEDGQRLTVDNGQITGSQNPDKGLAFETGNVLDEKEGEQGSACPKKNNSNDDDAE